ncbi:hypothetical protein [uncultured Corynebacterium sp.]|uniref:hypothetical protein n=1 Tax=uncultured Corynebacterium sp. TaxID=159447 RepID=UPI0025D98F08|nr:hypothetical protein [uncultured Corynebacterium sp.]
MTAPRKRRRAQRLSDAVDYDRTADRPPFQSAFGDDGERIVQLDPDGAEGEADEGGSGTGEQFYREQQPPHYGGEV